jgi:hypothetical protein
MDLNILLSKDPDLEIALARDPADMSLTKWLLLILK